MISAKDASLAFVDVGIAKSKKPTYELIVMGIMAGIFIAFGSAMTNYAMHAMENPGLARVVCSLLFPIGLCMVIFTGSELFTGNSLMGIALYDKKITIGGLLRNWGFVYLGNLIGSALIAIMIVYCNQLNANGMKLAVFTINLAKNKAALPLNASLLTGIMCNILVCLAVFMASQAKSASSKIIAAYLPITIFVLGAFEHVVANMYYLIAGLLANSVPQYAQAAIEAGVDTSSLNFSSAILNNIIPVTIGNVIGGMLFAFVLWSVYVKPSRKS